MCNQEAMIPQESESQSKATEEKKNASIDLSTGALSWSLPCIASLPPALPPSLPSGHLDVVQERDDVLFF